MYVEVKKGALRNENHLKILKKYRAPRRPGAQATKLCTMETYICRSSAW